MEDNEIFLDNGMPNLTLKEVCDGLFFGSTELAGNIGLKNLANIVSLQEQDFQAYLNAENVPSMQEDDLSQ